MIIRVSNNDREIIHSSSAIGQQLIDSPDCFNNYNLDNFNVISNGRTDFHLKTLKVI